MNWKQDTRAGGIGLVLIALAGTVTADTLSEVRARGQLRCGVNPGLAGFAVADSLGRYSGFDVDICRAVSAAVFDDPDRVSYVPLTANERFDALNAGTIDVLSRNTTWTLEREVRFGSFVGISYHDGQGFMVRKDSGIRSALELDRQPVCVIEGTTTEQNAIEWFETHQMRYRPNYAESADQTRDSYAKGECVVLTGDRSALAAQRSTLERPEAHRLLPEVISKEPLGPMVAMNDQRWEQLVRWSLNCLINAEELGVNQRNLESELESQTPSVQRLLGTRGATGSLLGLEPDWCAAIIRAVGNYGDIHARHLGERTALALPRGTNALWTDGGLIHAPPIR